MSHNNNEDKIGFDPLAWMDEDNKENQGHAEQAKSSENAANLVQQPTESNDTNEQSEHQIVEQEASHMNSNKEQESKVSGEPRMVLEAEINIQKVADLQQQLIASLEQNDQIEIDAEQVNSIDTASLQLLVVFKQEAVKLHKQVVIIASERFIDSAKLLGIAEMLEVV